MNRCVKYLLRYLATAATLACPLSHADQGLEKLEAQLNQPVNAASKYAEDAAAAPAAVTVLTAGDIRTYGWRTLGEVLNGVRGIYLRDERIYTYIGVRGFARPGDYSSRLLITIDGMRINDNIYDQSLGGREFPLEAGLIERVEFIAGPGSSLYGSNALLGAINIVTKTAAALAGTSVAATAGSESARGASLRHGSQWDGGSLVLAAHFERRPGADRYFREFDSPATFNGVARGVDDETDRKLYAKWNQGGLQAAFV